MNSWLVSRTSGSADDFHRKPVPDPVEPQVWIHEVGTPALILGSTQSLGTVDAALAASHKIEVCKRNSGGGLLRVEPQDLWIDVVLPRSSHLWQDDVGASMLWVGRAWAAAFEASNLGVAAHVHDGPLHNSELGRLICFAGLGAGEVLLDDHKVVGVSQRRTRVAARYQCLVKLRWSPADIRPYLAKEKLSDVDICWDSLKIGLPAEITSSSSLRDQLPLNFLAALPEP